MSTRILKYVVVSKTYEAPSIATLSLVLVDGSLPDFHAGQLLTIYFHDLHPTLGKPYSISSAPFEGTLTITVKAIGPFSKRLCSLEFGDVLLGSEPYDGGLSSSFSRATVMLAGGMGVTPFRGMLLEATMESVPHRTSLFYSGKSSTDLIFAKELSALALLNPRITVERFVTQEASSSVPATAFRRILASDFLAALDETPTDFFICGPLSFVLEQKDALVNHDISRANIYTETH